MPGLWRHTSTRTFPEATLLETSRYAPPSLRIRLSVRETTQPPEKFPVPVTLTANIRNMRYHIVMDILQPEQGITASVCGNLAAIPQEDSPAQITGTGSLTLPAFHPVNPEEPAS